MLLAHDLAGHTCVLLVQHTSPSFSSTRSPIQQPQMQCLNVTEPYVQYLSQGCYSGHAFRLVCCCRPLMTVQILKLGSPRPDWRRYAVFLPFPEMLQVQLVLTVAPLCRLQRLLQKPRLARPRSQSGLLQQDLMICK